MTCICFIGIQINQLQDTCTELPLSNSEPLSFQSGLFRAKLLYLCLSKFCCSLCGVVSSIFSPRKNPRVSSVLEEMQILQILWIGNRRSAGLIGKGRLPKPKRIHVNTNNLEQSGQSMITLWIGLHYEFCLTFQNLLL